MLAPNLEIAIDVIWGAEVSPGDRVAVTGLGLEARIIIASWYGVDPVKLPRGGRFRPHRVTIRSSQVARIEPRRQPRWSYARRFDLVGLLLQQDVLDRLIAPSVPLLEAPRIYAELPACARSFPPQRVFDAASSHEV